MNGSQHSGPRYRTGSESITEDTIDYPAYFAPPLTTKLYSKNSGKSTVTYRIGLGTAGGNAIEYIKKEETPINVPSDFFNSENIKDRILMQKILPKLHGNKGQLSSVIEKLLDYSIQNNFQRTKEKLESMIKELKFPGFTNFFS